MVMGIRRLLPGLPDTVQDKEQLYEDAAEGQNPSHDDARQWLGVEGLLRNLTWDLIGSNWVFNGL